MTTTIRLDRENCKGCELCFAFCPKKILEADKSYLNRAGVHPATCIDESACIACGNCALMCPDGIITIEKNS